MKLQRIYQNWLRNVESRIENHVRSYVMYESHFVDYRETDACQIPF
jgi:hypothetical protein